ncbi:hypothetical protein COU78_04500 [Candidatus Peregrinibacteria bacterium CG10_big_fil_rev_8_21_14_0_10_49_24]|nr:MAG: hypothetical protein COV83_06585 [Candidatus Peregrinibacteria bacterium CG11_big_fil_rev_8_21_14_0_20_49_14]PIR50808.1 MAG: hypothetical protein COU78_04500 [Candidatus Peregrinibacteria bacterium CG10_big_fil_rev_8_21_14_0_10_49_24]PJA67296.1 MAG: hypothetical protein CO157_05390 [Candidatus Peregrinibacteria bacterium CG_4_9_14_3_um_filter_49_12]
MNQIQQMVCAMLLTGAFANVASAVEWKNETYQGVAVTSTESTIGGYYYRIKLNGRILQRESGSRTYRYVSIHDVPATARVHVAQRYDAFVPPVERDYGVDVTQRYSTTTTTDDHSNRSQTSDDHSSRTREYRFESYRDRDVDYTAHTRGTNAPVVIANDNHHSNISVHVHPVDATMAMLIAAQNNQLTQQVIAANRGQSQAEAELRIERNRPPQIQVVKVEVPQRCHQEHHCNPCKPVCLRARCWSSCGRQFKDQYGRTWNHHSGAIINNHACSVQGCLGQLPDGRLTITIKWSGGTSVYVDP